MRSRPKLLCMLSLLLVAVAASFPLQIMAIYGHGIAEMGSVLAKLTYLNWAVMIVAGLSAVFAFEASPRLRYVIPSLIGLVALNNFFVGYHQTDFSAWTALLSTLAFAGVQLPLHQTDIRMLLANPDRRWWRASRRKSVHVPVVMSYARLQPMKSETFDLSESGMFVPLKHEELKLESRIGVCLTLGAFAQIRCEARVVRKSEAKGKYPSGVGLEFLGLSREQRQEIKKYLSRQPSI